MPDGYVYHDGLYKTDVPHGPSRAALISQTQSRQIADAMTDLVERLTDRAGLAPGAVYVDTPAPASQIESLMDNDLRSALRRAGYLLTDQEDQAAYRMTHRIKPVTLEDGMHGEMAIDIYDARSEDGALLTSELGYYRIDSLDKIVR